jgi:hypothetical protein
MTKVQQTSADLEGHLDEQLELLRGLADLYDGGSLVAAKAMATSLRVLLHDTGSSKSLLGQLDRKGGSFCDTAEVRGPDAPNTERVGSFAALLGIAFGGVKGGYVPHLDGMAKDARLVGFDEYWNEEIFVDQKKNSFTRKDIVLYVANQDGGSHVDPALDKKYQELSRRNSLGWRSGSDEEWSDLKGAELASVRQIAHEILKTLIPDYEVAVRDQDQGAVIGGGGFILHFANPDEKPIRRQGPCPCGSGKKYKRCCEPKV